MVTVFTLWLAPRPKSSSFECCEMKPEPAVTTFVRRKRSVSTVTRAPTASRFVLVPVRRTARDAVRSAEVVAEEPELRRRARRHHREVRVSVLVVVEDREGSAVLVEVEAHAARHLVEVTLPVVAQEDVALVIGLGAVGERRG